MFLLFSLILCEQVVCAGSARLPSLIQSPPNLGYGAFASFAAISNPQINVDDTPFLMLALNLSLAEPSPPLIHARPNRARGGSLLDVLCLESFC
jgi:hypothetical protein